MATTKFQFQKDTIWLNESSNKKCESTLTVVLIKKYYEKHRGERQAARGRAAPDERDNNSKTK